MSQPRDDDEDEDEGPAAFSQGMNDELPSFSQESIELNSAPEDDGGGSDGDMSMSQIQTLSQDMREADAISLSQSSQASYLPAAFSQSEGGGTGETDQCRATLCFRPLGPDVQCEPPVGLERTGSISFHFAQQRAGPFQLVEHGWEGPSLVAGAGVELPRQQSSLEHTQLVLPKLEGWDFRALIVVIGRQMFVWPITTRTRPEVAPNGTSEYTFKVSEAHLPLDDRRRRKNYINMPCFSEVGVSENPSIITSFLEHYLDTYPGFSWVEAWVDELGYANSGRVLRFEPTGGATTELKWPVDPSTVLQAGAYELSMYILVDEGYETLPMFRASFELENERFGQHTLFTGCRGTRVSDPKAARTARQPGYWQQVTARVTLPSDALAFDFTVIGAGKMGKGGFYATGLSLHQVGKRLHVSVQQADGRQIVNRDSRIEGPGGGASIHSIEMSLLGQEAMNGMRRASFNMSVGYFDVAPNVDDDSLLVRFTMLWKGGLTGKEQLMAEHLNSTYYNKRLIRTDYKEDPSLDKPTGLAGFDQVVLHTRDQPGAIVGKQNEVYVMRRRLPPDGSAREPTGVSSELEVAVDTFFEPCGDEQIDTAHEKARARGELVGYTRLGKLKVLGIDLWSSCGLWPSKKATHKGGFKQRGAAAGGVAGGTGRFSPLPGRNSGGVSPFPGMKTDDTAASAAETAGGAAGAATQTFTLQVGPPSASGAAGTAGSMTEMVATSPGAVGLKRKADQLEAAAAGTAAVAAAAAAAAGGVAAGGVAAGGVVAAAAAAAAAAGGTSPENPRGRPPYGGIGSASFFEGGTFPGLPSPLQPIDHRSVDIWKFPPKRVLLQVDLPARFWDDDRGTRLYVDFRSQESKDTKRHREVGAMPGGEEGALIKQEGDAAAGEAAAAAAAAATAAATAAAGAAAAATAAVAPAAASDGDLGVAGGAPAAAAAAAAATVEENENGSAINALTALAGIAM